MSGQDGDIGGDGLCSGRHVWAVHVECMSFAFPFHFFIFLLWQRVHMYIYVYDRPNVLIYYIFPLSLSFLLLSVFFLSLWVFSSDNIIIYIRCVDALRHPTHTRRRRHIQSPRTRATPAWAQGHGALELRQRSQFRSRRCHVCRHRVLY